MQQIEALKKLHEKEIKSAEKEIERHVVSTNNSQNNSCILIKKHFFLLENLIE
jgi:hypothetical protein